MKIMTVEEFMASRKAVEETREEENEFGKKWNRSMLKAQFAPCPICGKQVQGERRCKHCKTYWTGEQRTLMRKQRGQKIVMDDYFDQNNLNKIMKGIR